MANINAHFKDWQELTKQIQQATAVLPDETPAQKQERIRKNLSDYNAFCRYYFPHYAENDCAPFHTRIAKKVIRSRYIKAIINWFRGSGKSVHFDLIIPLLLMALGELRYMILVGHDYDTACQLLDFLKYELEYNERYIDDFGAQKNLGQWEKGLFITRNSSKFEAMGMNQSARGKRHMQHRPDYIVCDDLEDKQTARNPARAQDIATNITREILPALSKKRHRFFVVNNKVSNEGIIATLIDEKVTWLHSEVPALDKKGRPTWEAFTKEYIDMLFEDMGYADAMTELMLTPITKGKIFKNDWIKWKKLPRLNKYSRLVLYLDPSYKDHGDYKAAKLWGSYGQELHCIKAFVRQCGKSEVIEWIYGVYEALPEDVILHIYFEASFMQDDIFMDAFDQVAEEYGYHLPVIPDLRKKPNKFERIESMSFLWRKGLVYYNEAEREDPDYKRGLDQLLAFEKGSGAADDAPDADEGAIWLLQKHLREPRMQKAVRIGLRKKRGVY